MTYSKKCPACGGSGPFGRNKRNSDGLAFYCKECRRRDQVVFYANNPDKIKAMRARNERS